MYRVIQTKWNNLDPAQCSSLQILPPTDHNHVFQTQTNYKLQLIYVLLIPCGVYLKYTGGNVPIDSLLCFLFFRNHLHALSFIVTSCDATGTECLGPEGGREGGRKGGERAWYEEESHAGVNLGELQSCALLLVHSCFIQATYNGFFSDPRLLGYFLLPSVLHLWWWPFNCW